MFPSDPDLMTPRDWQRMLLVVVAAIALIYAAISDARDHAKAEAEAEANQTTK